MNLDPAKLLVILVIGLLVLGPERLPRVARQLGRIWQEFTSARDRIVDEIKEQLPDLPNARSFRSVLVDPLSVAGSGVQDGSPVEASNLIPVSDAVPVIAWSAHQRKTLATPSLQDRDSADPAMN